MSGNVGSSTEDVKHQKVLLYFLDRIRSSKDNAGNSLSKIVETNPLSDNPNDLFASNRPTCLKAVQLKIESFAYRDLSEFVFDIAQLIANVKFLYHGSQSYALVCLLEEFCILQLQMLHRQGFTAMTLWPQVQASPAMMSQKSATSNTYRPSSIHDQSLLSANAPNAPNASKQVKHEEQPSDLDSEFYGEEAEADTELKRKFARDESVAREDDIKHRKLQQHPTKYATPLEAKAKVIMRQVRRYRDVNGRQLFAPFERLPDPRMFPEYYQAIRYPMALDVIQKKLNKNQYTSLDEFVSDFNLMFSNAKSFNDPSSQVYRDADFLQKYLADVIQMELGRMDVEGAAYDIDSHTLQRHDKQYQTSINYEGTALSIGDWIFLKNQSDPGKPVVAQIFKIWNSSDQTPWVTVCWYFRPEQTVHRADRIFYENEVFKTSLYRDHPVSDIVGRCFVMYITRYVRGRPKGIRSTPVFVCESRYNDDTKQFSKIKSWKGCMPEELRGFDYEMILFDHTIPPNKVPSPLLHLFSGKAQVSDDQTQMALFGNNSMNEAPAQGAILPASTNLEENINPSRVISPSPSESFSTTPKPSYLNPTPSAMPTYARKTSSHSDRSQSHLSRIGLSGPGMYGSAGTFPMINQSNMGPLPARPFYGGAQDVTAVQQPQHLSNLYGTKMNSPYTKMNVVPQAARPSGSVGNLSGLTTPLGTAYNLHSMPPLPSYTAAFIIPGTHQKEDGSAPGQGVDEKTTINVDTAQVLNKDDSGNILWYSVPPQDPVPIQNYNSILSHSLEYLEFKRKKSQDPLKEMQTSSDNEEKFKHNKSIGSALEKLQSLQMQHIAILKNELLNMKQ
ncbi:RSC complex subunit Rsc1 [Schizosaccharomyces cryophilus OY26]|uniref:RSC complex subunit Rsc1 n=1 Tax=Schizosaccharomyces cryophilus (strain OY26 / ATCC MYA-4695 / CBS 11777 / NBRC 106824 / NRRL Y48691) TaxID=653667 RepID=S9X9N0_SCHCR|nr:RSC complex subunit Rsc1 [Schizosaccharomyces cryophilus OY26]EPY50466.1 RSC complex subunit Rsc1 [Schizosaccharomyces cryophilus OY26]